MVFVLNIVKLRTMKDMIFNGTKYNGANLKVGGE
jgi:hypothetical protein